MRIVAPLFLVAALPTAALAQDLYESAAFEHFSATFEQVCFWDGQPESSEYFPAESWPLTWTSSYSDTEETATLYKFFCGSGAYNVNNVYYLETEFSGPMPVAFSTPSYEVVYENDDYEGAVLDIPVYGFDAQFLLTNSEFDPETGTISDNPLWRGIGDAFSSGTWAFVDGAFVLKSYMVDASYDGEMNPKRIVHYE